MTLDMGGWRHLENWIAAALDGPINHVPKLILIGRGGPTHRQLKCISLLRWVEAPYLLASFLTRTLLMLAPNKLGVCRPASTVSSVFDSYQSVPCKNDFFFLVFVCISLTVLSRALNPCQRCPTKQVTYSRFINFECVVCPVCSDYWNIPRSPAAQRAEVKTIWRTCRQFLRLVVTNMIHVQF